MVAEALWALRIWATRLASKWVPHCSKAGRSKRLSKGTRYHRASYQNWFTCGVRQDHQTYRDLLNIPKNKSARPVFFGPSTLILQQICLGCDDHTAAVSRLGTTSSASTIAGFRACSCIPSALVTRCPIATQSQPMATPAMLSIK